MTGSTDVATALDDLATIDIGALSAEHALVLVEAPAPSPVDPLVAQQIVNACDGCPLALVEASRSLSPEQLSGVSVLPRNLPVGPRLEAHFQRQVRDLPPATQTLCSWQPPTHRATKKGSAGPWPRSSCR